MARSRCVSLPQSPRRYLRFPRFFRRPESDALELGLIAWENTEEVPWPGKERILRYPVASDGSLGEAVSGKAHDAIQGIDEHLEPTGAQHELQARAGGALACIEVNDGIARLWLESEGRRHLVWAAQGSAAAPALCHVAGSQSPTGDAGWWVAWHHDVREDTGAADIIKWLSLRFVDAGGNVWVAGPLKGIERDSDGEEQGFEFPSLCLGPDGALALFGRGSHNFWRQDLNAHGWSERTSFSDGHWGSRGRRVAVAILNDEQLITARRERRNIAVETAPLPQGGAPAVKRIEVTDVAPTAKAAASDFIRPGEPNIYFGDIQQHSAHSDGCGSADEAYQRARWRYGDDFVALTDHESFLGKRTGPGEWRFLQETADRHNDPGSFATLLAYEWTGKMHPGPGHKCVYLPHRGMPLVSRDVLPEGKDLVQRIKELGGIASPHHIGWTGCDEAGHDPEGQPVWEICSCHGCYEHPDHPLGMRGEHTDQLADAMLRKGHRFGFTASSDSHGLLWHHGESRKRDPYRTGLTAVLCDTLNRDAIFEALKRRRCYGTSGAKILLQATCDAAPMGSILKANGGHIIARCRGTAPIVALEIIGPEGIVASAEGSGFEATLEAEVHAPYAYVRARQEDGEMAWASPFFFEG